MTPIRIISTILGAAAVPFIFWLGGYDFNTRGLGAVMVFIYTVFVAAFIAFNPYWDK